MEISDFDKIVLEGYNQDVERNIKKRTTWLDRKMVEYSDLQVGDDIYALRTGFNLGVVTKLYRYITNPLFDDNIHIHYQYKVGDDIFSNTSSQPSIAFGTKSQALKWAKNHLKELENEIPD